MHSHYGKYKAFWEAKTCIGRKMRCIGQVLDEYWTCIGQELLPENRGVLVENKGVLDLSAHRLGDLATKFRGVLNYDDHCTVVVVIHGRSGFAVFLLFVKRNYKLGAIVRRASCVHE